MHTLGGRFNGTGAKVYLCIGFVPDFVGINNVEAAIPLQMTWNKYMTDVLCNEGIYTGSDGTTADLANGEGIKRYYGGDTLVAGTGTLGVGTTTYGEGVFLKWDIADGKHDYRYLNTDKMHTPGDAATEIITTWNFDAGYTGHFNGNVTGTYIGEGSKICIDVPGKGPREYTIVALTAGAGSAAAAVTIDETGVPDGVVRYIRGMYDLVPMVAGEVTPQGFSIEHATLNANGNTINFTAGLYD